MPSNKTKPENVGLSGLLEGLSEAGIEFVLVGGLASVVQGAPIATMDVDIVPRLTDNNIDKLLVFLKSVEAYHRRLDEKLIKPTKKQISGRGHNLLTTRLGPLDVLGVIEEDKSYEDLIEHTVEIAFRGHTLRVLDLEVLIKLKRSTKDAKEKLRLPILEETLSQLKQKGVTVGKVKKARQKTKTNSSYRRDNKD